MQLASHTDFYCTVTKDFLKSHLCTLNKELASNLACPICSPVLTVNLDFSLRIFITKIINFVAINQPNDDATELVNKSCNGQVKKRPFGNQAVLI